MSLVDEITISAKAGDGGNGVVRWLHLKGKEYSGPAGGNGGNGGDVYIRGVRDINLLARYRGSKEFAAENGADGGNQNKIGKSAEDLIINLPTGSIVTNTLTHEVFDLTHEDETILVLKGGRGGIGNAAFKSSVNRRPEESTPGAKGEEGIFFIELRLIADAGFVGLPNAGKTSLLNALTEAGAKVAAYPFTTLDPNLGMLFGTVLADIPGLIEGAAEGKGLGYKFLRHIARTRLLVHCVSLQSESPLGDYDAVRKEIEAFESGLLREKKELVVLTKSDTTTTEEIKKVVEMFQERGHASAVVSVLDDTEIKLLSDRIIAELRVL